MEEAERFGLTVADLCGPSRKAHIVAARHSAIQRIGRETALSLPVIAKLFCRRDHTTILHALRKPEAWQYGDGTAEWLRGSLDRFSVPSHAPIKKERNAAIIERRKQGAMLREIASEFDLSEAVVWKICRDVPKPPKPPPPPRRYTPRHLERNAEIIRLRADGLTLQEIGRRFGLTREGVRLITIEVPAPLRHRPAAEIAARNAVIVEQFRQGRAAHEIAAEFGIVPPCIYAICKGRVGRRARMDCRRALNAGRDAAIVARRQAGATYRVIAEEFGLQQMHVWHICNRKD